jgi:hypothetical protein
MLKALHKAGIDAAPGLFEKIDTLPGFYMGRYEGKPDYDESFFQVKGDKLKAESLKETPANLVKQRISNIE